MTPSAPSLSPPGTVLGALQALADENRLRILETLRGRERCVCEIQESLGLGQSLLSHHLRALREAGLVVDRREGRWVHYSLSQDAFRQIEEYVRDMRVDAAHAEPGVAKCVP